MTSKVEKLPSAFVWRRLHSLTGFFLALFLIEHLLVNSQAALLLGESGRGFIKAVNAIHNLPYLQVIEIFLLGVPIFIHLVWGVRYLFTAKYNSLPNSGKAPYLNYGRNHAYTWQRITSWILVVLLLFHIVKFRFVEYPSSINLGERSMYFVKVSIDNGLYTVADRIGVKLYDEVAIQQLYEEMEQRRGEAALLQIAEEIRQKPDTGQYEPQAALILQSAQKLEEKQRILNKLESICVNPGQIIAASENFGSASLLTVRDAFKNPIYIAIYTVFVLAACFHGFNGFWTFLLTWGWILNMASQKRMVKVALGLMFIIAFLGLSAVWGTYWLNLKQ